VIAYRYAPVGRWPGNRTASSHRRPSYTFKVTWGALMRDLDRELEALHVREATIQIDVAATEIRRDGLPYANARPTTPAVILSFTHRVPLPLRDPQPRQEETLVFACDRYDHWHANLRAISLTLQALRGIDRWGAVREGQQYAGFRELPAPENAPNGGFRSRGQAAAYLTSLQPGPGGYTVDGVERDPVTRAALYRELVRRFHPDAPNGDAETMKRIGQARAYLDDEATR
jgi:hypothetical protein